jgi:hypothetical protein
VSHLDWNDAESVRRFLADLRVAVLDADAVTRDMLRRPSRRKLGPAKCRRLHKEAAAKIDALIAYASRPRD